MPEVSIIIVNYNGFDLLEKCLSTLQEFTKISYEIIIVDNGSTVGDVDKVALKFPNVKSIKLGENKGYAAANNVGLKEASGNYLLLLNNDIVFIEDVISATVQFLKSVNDEAIIGCKLLNEDGSHQVSVIDYDTISNLFGENFFLYKVFPKSKLLSKWNRNFNLTERVEDVEVVKGAYFFIPRKVFERVGLLDERFFFYYEETEYCYRYKKTGGRIIYYPVAKIIHVGGSSSDSNMWFKFYNQHVAKVQFFQKHFKGLKFAAACAIHYSGLLIRVPVYILAGTAQMNSSLFKKALCYLKTFFIYPKNIFKDSD
ncbi:MAG: glycosyltransferase family 2 protein [Ignavibacteria bacterium]|nr:glycosyltransferase family 2 protein [Ignavibacteria bacterium]